ncbi:hypothetical protein C0580_03030 [Candidatus Parcubacteria bacterium]|nr:MAG: hypothetical protein C0580_03030 [Candidatus Parcubacteria bacterium]
MIKLKIDKNKTASRRKAVKRKPKVKQYKHIRHVTLPLYFGWELIIAIRRLEDWRLYLSRPFKVYWHYMTVVAFFVVSFSAVFFIFNSFLTHAATYYFVQTDWSGGNTVEYPNHTSNRTGWTKYTSKDSNITAGTEITITEAITTLTETSDTDFNAGATSTAEVSGSGDSAYVALSTTSGSNGLINNAGASEYALELEVVGNYAYVANGLGGLFIYDVSDPANPTYVSDIDTGLAYNIKVYGDYVYVADSSVIDIVDVSTKSSPSIVNTISDTGGPNDFVIQGTTMYVAWDQSGCSGYCADGWIIAYDITDPLNPSEIASTANLGEYLKDIYVEGDYLYASQSFWDSGDWSLTWYDISNPSAITQVNFTAATNEYTYGLAVVGQYVFMANSTDGVHVFSTSTDSLVHTYNTAGNAVDLAINGDTMYIAEQNSSIFDVDISNPLSISFNGTHSSTAAKGVFFKDGYLYVADNSAGLRTISIPSYVSSGTFTSQILDTSANSGFGNISWTSTEPGGTSLSVKVRTSNDAAMSGATAWASCDAVTSGNDISANNCVTDGHQYVQYQVTLSSSESSRTPQLSDLSIQYTSYTNGSLLSSAFNTQSSANVMGSVEWNSTGTGTIQMQIRTAPDDGADAPDWASGSGWCGPITCAATTGDTDYANSYHTSSGSSVHLDQTTGDDDQWFQYRIWLTSADGASTPSVEDITMIYVVNAPPEFQSAAIASQGSDGVVTISYSVRDPDATSGTATPGEVTPSFQYSTNNGVDWYNITGGMSAGATSTQSVGESAYSEITAYWTPRNQGIEAYSTQTKIRVTVDDSEGANNTASSDTAAFTMDAKTPTVGNPAVRVIATTTPSATLIMDASDDTTLQMCITLDESESNCVSYDTYSTLSLSTDPDTAYVIFKDAYSNTNSQSAVTPETPQNMIIRDLSNTSSASTTPEYRLFISWAAVSTPVSEFANYEVWHSTDGSNYSLLDTITDRSINYYLHDNLVADSAHYYKVSTTDKVSGTEILQNTSYFSSVVSDTANGQGGTDASPPTISSVSVSSINTQSAIITWTTDELSNSTVGYSTTPANFDDETGVASMVTDHSVTLSGLTPGETYYFRVKSSDPDTNEATDSSGGDGYTFNTLSGPAISNVSASTVQNTSATITWNTDIASDSAVYYSVNSDMSDYMVTPTDSTSVTDHSVSISDLTAGTKYYFYVKSGVAIDNNVGDYYYFNTTSDSTAPVITSVDTNVITDDDAVIGWTTDELANAQVYFGTASDNYSSSTAVTSTYNTSHDVWITPLANNTKYYYRVVSVDQAGNISTSSTEYDFTTLEQLSTESEVVIREEEAADNALEGYTCGGGGGGGSSRDYVKPKITNINLDDTDPQAVKVVWDTSENAISVIQYGVDSIEENSLVSAAALNRATQTHEMVLDNLSSNQNYKYKVLAIDAAGNIGESDELEFTNGSFIPEEGEGDGGETPSDTVAEESFLLTIDQAAEYIARSSNNVSIAALESGLLQLQDLANIVPPPIISGEPVVTIGTNSAIIEWSTDDEANALVSYASESYYFANDDYESTIGLPDYYSAGDHRVTLLGLEPETNYHYKIVSKKEVGSSAESKDFSFTTLAELAEIESYTTDIVSTEEVVFKWVTTIPTDTRVDYTPYRNGSLAVDEKRTERNEIFTTIHQMTIEDMEAGVLYQVDLYGNTTDEDVISQSIPSFATSDDNLPPVIKQVKTDAALSVGKDTKVQAIVSWYTNEPSTSRVLYEQGAGRSDEELTQSSPIDDNYARHHVVVITNFNPGAIYRFQVESTDTEGNSSRSRTYTILTPKQQESVFQVIMRNVEETFGWVQF